MDQPVTIKSTHERLRELAADICMRPEIPAGLAEELRQLYFTLRNHAWLMEYEKRRLIELAAEIDLL